MTWKTKLILLKMKITLPFLMALEKLIAFVVMFILPLLSTAGQGRFAVSIRSRMSGSLVVVSAAMAIFLILPVHFQITGHFAGLFLLREKSGHGFEISDEIVTTDKPRIVCGFDLKGTRSLPDSLRMNLPEDNLMLM